MAIVKEVKKNFAQRLADAAEGVGQAMQKGVELRDKLANSQAQRDRMTALNEQLNAQKQQTEQKMKLQAHSGLFNVWGLIGGIDDPQMQKSYAKMYAPQIQEYNNILGIPQDQDMTQDMVPVFAKSMKNFKSAMDNYQAVIQQNPTGASPEEMQSKLGQMVSLMPPSYQKIYAPMVDQMAQSHSKLLQEQKTKETAEEAGLSLDKIQDGKITYSRVEQDKVTEGLSPENSKAIINQLNRFRDKEAKAEAEALSEANKIKGLLASGDNNAAIELSKTLFVKLAGDPRPSNDDLKRISPNPAVYMQLKKLRDQIFLNKGLAEDNEALTEMANTLITASQEVFKGKIKDFSKSRADLIGLKPEELEDRLLTGYGSVLAPVTQPKTEPKNQKGQQQQLVTMLDEKGQTVQVPANLVGQYKVKLGYTIPGESSKPSSDTRF